MSEDATLDAFAGEDEADDDESTGRPEPPSLTYTSSPDGDACAECGETVENRWRAGEGAEDPNALVCPECKVW
jgi:hypothetical protein